MPGDSEKVTLHWEFRKVDHVLLEPRATTTGWDKMARDRRHLLKEGEHRDDRSYNISLTCILLSTGKLKSQYPPPGLTNG